MSKQSLSLTGAGAEVNLQWCESFQGFLVGVQMFSRDVFKGMRLKQIIDSDVSIYDFIAV